jgi:hypothetical protein
MEIVMPILKSLTFTNLPDRSRDPVANRRAKLVSRLEEQRQLLQDPSYVRVTQRWAGKGDERRQVEKKQPVRPWWRADASGNVEVAFSGESVGRLFRPKRSTSV